MLLLNDITACALLKTLELMSKRVLKWKAVSTKVVGYDAYKQADSARLERIVKCFEELQDRTQRKRKPGNSGSSSGSDEKCSPKARTPKAKYERELESLNFL